MPSRPGVFSWRGAKSDDGGWMLDVCQMLVRVPDLEKDLTESMLEESPGPHWGTSSPVTYRQVLYKGHSSHSACHCCHVPKKYLFSSSASWGSWVLGLLRGFPTTIKRNESSSCYWHLAWWPCFLQVLIGGDVQSYSVLSSIAACTGLSRADLSISQVPLCQASIKCRAKSALFAAGHGAS